MRPKKSDLGSVSTVGQFAERVRKFCDGGRWVFRGQSQSFKLLPKIARNNAGNDWHLTEAALLQEFKRRATSLGVASQMTEWELLSLGQHHGVPTRLLDWTRSALIALWFATREAWHDSWNSDSIVWMMQLEDADLIDPHTTKESPYDGKGTRFFEPLHVSPRITAQEGLFSVHRFSKAESRFVTLDSNIKYRDRLCSVRIKKASRPRVLKELSTLGVHAASVFPDLAGVAEYLTAKYQFADVPMNMTSSVVEVHSSQPSNSNSS